MAGLRDMLKEYTSRGEKNKRKPEDETRAPTRDLLDANARKQWMDEVEAGATSLNFSQWMSTHQHELPR